MSLSGWVRLAPCLSTWWKQNEGWWGMRQFTPTSPTQRRNSRRTPQRQPTPATRPTTAASTTSSTATKIQTQTECSIQFMREVTLQCILYTQGSPPVLPLISINQTQCGIINSNKTFPRRHRWPRWRQFYPPWLFVEPQVKRPQRGWVRTENLNENGFKRCLSEKQPMSAKGRGCFI